MKLATPIPTQYLADLLQCRVSGDAQLLVHGINEIHRVAQGDLAFVDHPKYYDKALNSAATTIIINQEVACPVGKSLLISDDPCRDFNRLTRHFAPLEHVMQHRGLHVVGEGSQVHPSVIMGNNVSIGHDCIIHPGVVIYDNVTIGNSCIVHAQTTLGSDAFYYKSRPEGRDKMHSCGHLIIEDHVEIGAACTIDKGLTAETRIGKGTKIDNQVHIGHDTHVGKNCLLAAQVGVAGCVDIGDGAILWGQVGVASGICIGAGAVVLGQSGVTKNIEPGRIVFGTPAADARRKYKELALLRSLESNSNP